MTFQVLSASLDQGKWDSLVFYRFPTPDVHFTSAYVRLQTTSEITGRLAVFDDGNDLVIQPFMMQRLPSGLSYDITSPYGYGGSISKSNPPGPGFQKAFLEWARDSNVVAEHCCLNPFYKANLSSGPPLLLAVRSKPVVVIDLQNFSLEKTRRRVRRGYKNAVSLGMEVTEEDNSISALQFWDLYRTSMETKGANAAWRHSYNYFSRHDFEPVGARWFFIKLGAQYYRALLTIGIGETAYAHFLGTSNELRHEGLDEMLYLGAASALARSGFKYFHLGGGLTTDPMDSLLAFKSGFSDMRLTAWRFGRVFDQSAYDSLLFDTGKNEVKTHGRISIASWFPAYRRPFL
jgi:hypothetical protein